MIVDYKDLVVWKKSIDLSVEVYEVSKLFPSDERFGLTNQVRRASVSVPSNIAEGQGRCSDRDFLRFLYIANGSRQEIETQLVLAERLGMASAEQLALSFSLVAEVGRVLFGLIATIKRSLGEPE